MRKAGKNNLKSFHHIEQSLYYDLDLTLKIAHYVCIIFSFTLPQINISNMDVRKCSECVDEAQQSNAQLQDLYLEALKCTCM